MPRITVGYVVYITVEAADKTDAIAKAGEVFDECVVLLPPEYSYEADMECDPCDEPTTVTMQDPSDSDSVVDL